MLNKRNNRDYSFFIKLPLIAKNSKRKYLDSTPSLIKKLWQLNIEGKINNTQANITNFCQLIKSKAAENFISDFKKQKFSELSCNTFKKMMIKKNIFLGSKKKSCEHKLEKHYI